MSEESGWYPDPYFGGHERYWDGDEWTEQCRSVDTKAPQLSTKPRAPLHPEMATPSATTAKFAPRVAGVGIATAARARTTGDAPASAPAGAPFPWPTRTDPPLPVEEEPALTEEGLAEVETPDRTQEQPSPSADAPTETQELLAESDASAQQVPATPPMDEPSLTEEVLADAEGVDPAVAPSAPAAAPPIETEELLAAADVATETEDLPAPSEEDIEHPTEPAHADLEGSGLAASDEAKAAGTAEKPPRRRRRRRIIVAVVAFVIVIAFVVPAVVSSLSKGTSTNSSSGSQVAQAASATVGQQYAQVNVTTNPDKSQDKAVAAAISGFSANGTYDFATSLGSLTLSAPDNGGSESVVLDGQTIYLDPGAVVGELVKGKTWVSATADDLGADTEPSGFAVAPTLFVQLVGNPTTLLQQLEAKGVTTKSVGASIYQGTPVDEYAVTLTPQAVALVQNSLPASLRGAVVTDRQPEYVYVTSSGATSGSTHPLIRAISVPVSVVRNGVASTGDVVVAFSAWGNQVDIVAPAGSEVATWAQLQGALTYANGLG